MRDQHAEPSEPATGALSDERIAALAERAREEIGEGRQWYLAVEEAIRTAAAEAGANCNDTRRLDFLEQLQADCLYGNGVILRDSLTGRGWRLHPTTRGGAALSVREAIDAAIRARDGQDRSGEGG